jgi:predicted GIY-YIG superfamily endonuclease
MTKTELKEAKEKYFQKSKMIQLLSYNSLFKETAEQQEQRIKRLLKPENYLEFFEYYFGVNSGGKE